MPLLKAGGGLLLAYLNLYFRSWILPETVPYPDGFLILVVYYGVTRPRVPAMLLGTVAGLAQDSLSGTFGVHAFTKTTVGYLAGGLGSRFLLNQPLPQFLILLAGTGFEVLLQRALLAVIGQGFAWPDPGWVLFAGVVNAVVGVAIFRIVERFL
ncbi:MAG: rod shape-determining protein MreD [Acidobacteria bacterium]|nr:rod shape-determining protein MreD [Acidobacteriota bacterium]